MAEAISIPDLMQGGWRRLDFEFFREGVEICRLVRGEPEVALLRYAPGARVPRHLHTGLETIIVLHGSQSDEAGDYGPGSFVANPVGTVHAVHSEEGCVVLIQWTKPVRILDTAE